MSARARETSLPMAMIVGERERCATVDRVREYILRLGAAVTRLTTGRCCVMSYPRAIADHPSSALMPDCIHFRTVRNTYKH